MATVLPQVLVAHDWESARTSIAAYLAHLRPTYAVRAVCPLELEAVLVADTGSSVVVCKDLTETIAVHARGWVVLSLEGPNEAIVGVGDERSIIKAPDFDDVVTAIDGLLARFDSGVTVTPC